MAMLWLPGVERVEGNSAGGMNGDGSRKLLLHDTEGSSVAGAVAAYRANNSWPHLTVDCRRRRVVQHLPFNVAARSLQNRPGGADETNRDGSVLVQVEIVGFVNNRDGSMFGSRADYRWFGETIVGPVCRDWDIPIRSSVTWTAYDASYGLGAPQRLSVAAWDAYSGVLGHEHAPDNSHGDPGAIDIDLILQAAHQEDFDMTEAEAEAMFRRVLNDFIPTDLDPETVKEWVRLGVNAAARDTAGPTLGGKLTVITNAVVPPAEP